MITDEVLATSFVTAHFINNERTQIEVLTLEAPGSSNQISTVIEYDLEHPWCKSLLKVCDLDSLHENTYNRIKQQRAAFEKSVLNIARQEGLVFDGKKSESKFHLEMLKFIFNYKGEEDNEDLFAFKLASFELDVVKNCSDRTKKAAIRKAQTPLEVVVAISDIK